MGDFHHILFLLTICSLFMAVHAAAIRNEVIDEHPFNYGMGEAGKGPTEWGELNPKWKICKTGKFQSPIDLGDGRVDTVSQLGNLNRTYKPAPAVVRNRGHDIMVSWTGDAGGIIISGSEYKLKQCHWHTPSEHTVHGQKYNMELHAVHNNSKGQIAVVGVLYELGRPDKFIAKFLQHLKSEMKSENKTIIDEQAIDMGIINPWDIKLGSRKYFRYVGSLTVPPCTEGVIWTVLKKVRTVSREQIRALRNAVHDGFKANARPVQQWDGRSVYMYRPCV